MGITISKVKTPVKASGKGGANAQGVVVTKTSRGLKLTDNGVIKLNFKVVSKAEMQRSKHPIYKPLLP